MKKTISLILRRTVLQPVLIKYWFLTIITMAVLIPSFAANISSTAGGGNWNNAGTWVGGVIPAAGDNVTIAGNVTVTATAASTDLTINAGGTLTLNNAGLTVGGNWLNNGTFNGGGAGGTDNNPTGEKITFTGAAATIGGSSVTAFSGLTINTTGTVTVTSSTINLGTGQFYPGLLTLQSGLLDVGAGHTMNLVSQQATTITSTGGNFKSYGPGGPTINVRIDNGQSLNVNGAVTFDNIVRDPASSGNYNLQINTANAVHINGVLTVDGGSASQWSTSGNSPIWGTQSTLSINNNGQQYTPGGGNHKEWVQIAPGAGTVGSTAGYPNNVIIANVGNSASNYGTGIGYGVKLAGNWSINGILQIGTSATPANVDLDNQGTGTNNFSSGGVIIEPNSNLSGPGGTFNVNGNWKRLAASTNPAPFANNGGTIIFGAPSSPATADTISVVSGAESYFHNVVINGNVQLNNPVTLDASATLTLTSGVVTTTATNVLSVSNTATTAIVGGSSSSFINGPLAWTLAATSSANYIFPVGGVGPNTYLPLTLSPNTNSATTATVQAFNTGSGGTPDGTTVSSLSTTEYWSVATTANFTTGAAVSVTRPLLVGSFNALAKSTSQTGTYSAIGGTPSGTSINSASIGTNSPWFITMVQAPLSVQEVSSTNATCAGTTGSITVQGSGGTQPYTYQIDGGAYSSPATPSSFTFNGLLPGSHTAYVKDKTGAIAGPVTVTLLGSLQINNNIDTSICSGQTATLRATNLTASGATPVPTFSWSTSSTGTPVVGTNANYTTPALVTTTEYYVTSQLYDNILTNPGFEAGNTGFATDYAYSVTSPYGAAPGGHGGLYYIASAANQMCTGFTPYPPHSGGLMMICDGPINGTAGAPGGSRIWHQDNIAVSNGTTYTFSFYYGYADASNANQIAIYINGVNVGTVTMTAPWAHFTYNWTAATATATIALYDTGPNDNQDIGNDFMLDDLAFFTPCTVIDSIKVIVGTAAATGTVTPPLQSICSGATPGSDLKLTGNTNSVVRWEYSKDKTFATGVTKVTANTSQTFTATAIAALSLTDSTYFRAVVNGCTPGTTLNTDSVLIAITPPSVGGTLSPAATQTICSGASPTSGLTVSGYTGTITGWQSSKDKTFATGVTPINVTSATLTTAQMGTLTDSTYFRVAVSNGGCTTAYSDTVLIAVTPPSVGGTLSPAATQTVCSGASPTANLTVSGYTGTITGWQSSKDKTFATGVTAINVTNATLTTAQMGTLTDSTYFRAVVVNGSCSNAYSDTVLIAVTPASVGGTLSPAATQSICSGASPTANLIVSGYTGTITGWQSSKDKTFATGVTAINVTSATLTAAQMGTLTDSTYFRVVVSNGGCITAYSDTVLVAVTPPSVGGTLLPAAIQTICTGAIPSSDLTLSGNTGNVVRWEYSKDKTFATGVTPINNTTTTLTALSIASLSLTDSTYFHAVVSSGGCTVANSDSVLIIVIAPSVGGTLSPAATQTICSNSNPSSDLTLSGNTGNVTEWESSTDKTFATGVNIIANTTTTLTTTEMGALTTNTYFRAVVSNGGCSNAYSDTVLIAISNSIAGGTIASPQTICSGSSPNALILSGNGGPVQSWEMSSDKTFSTNATNLPVTSTTLTSVQIGPLTDSAYFYATVKSGTCPSVNSDTILIKVNIASVGGIADLGTGQTICSGSSPSDLDIANYAGKIIEWQSSPDKAFTNPTIINNTLPTLRSGIIGALTDSTYFRAVVQSGVCAAAYSDSILVAVTPTSVGGTLSPAAKQTICSGSTPTDITLSGNIGNVTNWESSPDATFSNPTVINNQTTTLTGASIATTTAGTTYYRAVVTSGVCNAANSDAVEVEVDGASTGGTLSPLTTQTICSGSTPSFDIALSGQTGNVIKWQSSADAAFTSPVSIGNPPSTVLTGASIGAVTVNTYYRAVVQNGVCGVANSDSLLIAITQPPAIPFVSDTAYCQNATAGPLTATAPPGATLTWYTNSGVSSTTAPTPSTVIPGGTDYFVTSSDGTCESPKAQITVTIYPIPEVNYGATQSILLGDSAALNPLSVSGVDLKYFWSPAIYLNSDTLAAPISKPLADQAYTITITSPGGCQASASLFVQVLQDFAVPNTFTPNHDGINDTWVIEELPKYPIQWVQVFDRYGQLLFESHGYSTPWDGTYKGTPVAAGTYYYIIELNGIISPKTGYVTVLR